jgi:hypothetical protein
VEQGAITSMKRNPLRWIASPNDLVSRLMCKEVQRAGQVREVEGTLEVAEGHRGGSGGQGRGRSVLSSRHPVDEVVDEDYQQVHVAPGRVDEVIPANADQIPVSREDGHEKLGPAQLDAGGERNGPAVCGVEGIQVHVSRNPAGAADPRADRHFVQIEVRALESGREALHDRADPAGGTPDMRYPVHAEERCHGMRGFRLVRWIRHHTH